MPDSRRAIVSNTTPLIALAVGTGSLDILRTLYARVVVPFEVADEMHAAGSEAPGVAAFQQATWLDRLARPTAIAPYLGNTLDRGEASVIQTALDLNIPLVCIDESVGRPCRASIRSHPHRLNRRAAQGPASGISSVHP